MKQPNCAPIQCKKCASLEKSVFYGLSIVHLSELAASKTTNQYKNHQVLFYEGNRPYGLYCISKGKIKVYKMDADGHQQIVRIIAPGSILGYRCLLADEPYASTAETIEESTICFIDKTTFFHILDTHPRTARSVMKLLAKDLRHAEDQELNLAHKNVRERLAELLLIFKARYGTNTTNGVRLDISLSRQELAEIIGTTQESVIRLISEFKNETLISVKGRSITLLNIPLLTAAANLNDD